MIKVLIIDDEPLVCKMYARALDPSEFQTQTVLDGVSGIELAKTFKPNIILLDIMMPELDGIQVMGNLKSDEATKTIPIVILTNLSGKYDITFAKSKGAIDYWIKDQVELEKLGDKIKEILQINSKNAN